MSTEQLAPRADINERTRKISNVLSNALTEILEDIRPLTGDDLEKLENLWSNELKYSAGLYGFATWVKYIKANEIE